VEDRLPAAALTELSARIRPRRDSIAQALSAAAQRVHGDVHGGNLLTDGQEVTGIIDCDLTRQENDNLPALALAAALGLIDYFVREHDLVEESGLRTAHWIGDNFDTLRLPASVFGV
jgi:Phosphotransferase enzyme family